MPQENEAANSCNEWCKKTLKQIKEASPLSLKITLQSVSPFSFFFSFLKKDFIFLTLAVSSLLRYEKVDSKPLINVSHMNTVYPFVESQK